MEADRVRIVLLAFPFRPPDDDSKPSESDQVPLGDPDDDLFDHRLAAFVKLDFDYLTALALAWNRVSPSEVRTRWAGADRKTVAHYFLGDE